MLITQNDNIFLHQNHPYDPLFCLANAQIPETLINLGASNCTSTTTTNIMTSTTTKTTKQDHVIINNINAGLDPNLLPKRPVKKDRHSKIYTAQGLRDRRVRLSIDIAREFFDLHDMLGFDKASKTLEWLLTKSKKAIKEVSRSKLRTTNINSTTTLSSANSECEQAASESPDHDTNNLEEGMSLAPKSKVLKEKLDMETLSESDLMNLLAKESRARARARARARTKEKRHNFCTTTKRLNYNVGQCGSSTSQISNQFGTVRSPIPGLNHGTGDRDQEEPVVMIRRKIRFPSISSDYVDHHDRDRDRDHDHQGQLFCGISKGEASNNVIYSCPSLLLTQNWDNINNSSSNSIRTASPHPSFCLPT